jgi:CheY-like chemotaxis protein
MRNELHTKPSTVDTTLQGSAFIVTGIGQKGSESVSMNFADSKRMQWKPLPTRDTGGAVQNGDGNVGKQVLIVEDEAYLCDLISDVLESEGHHTLSASNGREAMQKLREFRPDIILLDLMMPVMDGWEVMSRLRSNAELAEIPVVIITAIYDVKHTQRDTGAKAVLTKPFDIDQLADVVRMYAA